MKRAGSIVTRQEDYMFSGRAREDLALRKIKNARWAEPEHQPMSWKFAVAIAFILIVAVGAFKG